MLMVSSEVSGETRNVTFDISEISDIENFNDHAQVVMGEYASSFGILPDSTQLPRLEIGKNNTVSIIFSDSTVIIVDSMPFELVVDMHDFSAVEIRDKGIWG